MAHKRKAYMEDDSSEDDASYQPKRFQADADEDDWKPTKKSKGKGKTKNKSSTANTTEDMAITDELGTVATRTHDESIHVISRPESLREALLGWYQGVHADRGMPWRKPFDHSWNLEQKAQRAYEVWVSEIMLQQTQVATVIPYYNRWMEKFPTIRDLAASHIDVVNNLWKGLGYYSRAARLLTGAQKVVAEFGGRLPDNAQDMESKIPGIGRYSAGAICSIAYNQCVPVLDGNVHRLLSRLLALHAPPKSKQTLDILWAGASAFVKDADRPGDVNQALIELGSTICKGAKYATSIASGVHSFPDIEDLCSLCEPLPRGSLVTIYPMKAQKKKAREELDIVNVIEWREDVTGARWFLLVRRPEGGLLAGLHEFPTAPNVPVTISSSAQIAIVDTLLSALLVTPPRSCQTSAMSDDLSLASRCRASKLPMDNPGTLRIERIVPVGDVLHVFSHIKKTYRVQWVLLEGGTSNNPPSLIRDEEGEAFGPARPKTSNGTTSNKGQRRTAAATTLADKSQAPTNPRPGPTTQWILLDSVADANIGTGVLKIWRQVCALWEQKRPD